MELADLFLLGSNFAKSARLFEIRRAMRALCRFEGNRRETIRAILCRNGRRFWFFQRVHLPNDQKEHKRNDQKVKYGIEENTIVDSRGSRSFGRGHAGIILI